MLRSVWKVALLFTSSAAGIVLLIHVLSGREYADVGLTSQSRIEVEAAKVDAYDTLQKHDWIGAGTDVIKPNPCAAVNVTQTVMIPSADGLRINLVCTVLITETNPEDISIHWSGAGLRSMWVQQSSISQKGNKYERTLFFDPWIDVHAGNYICHVMINETKCAVEKSITLEGSYRGLVNSRSSSSKISHDLPKHSAWLPDGGFCGEPSIWTDYTKFHQSVLFGQQPGKYLMYECTSGDCGGYGNRMQSITTLLMLAMLTKRVFLLELTNPIDINIHLRPNAIQWNQKPPAGLKSKLFNLRGIKNFYSKYKMLETALGDNNSYDLIKVQTFFGLNHYLRTMSDQLLSKMTSTFQLKTLYDCVIVYGCAFNYLFKYQPETIKSIEAMQSKLGLETGKFVSLHVRTFIKDHAVFDPFNLKFPWQPMFDCALRAAKVVGNKMNISKVPIFLATDNQIVINHAQKFYKDDVVISEAPLFHVGMSRHSGPDLINQQSDGVLGIMSDIEISSRAAVFVRSAYSTLSSVIGMLHYLTPQHNLHPFYFYEDPTICEC